MYRKHICLVYCDSMVVEDIGFIEKIKVEKEKNIFYPVYEYFDKRINTKKLEKIVNNINNDLSEKIVFFTSIKNLFVEFNGNVYISDFKTFFYQRDKINVLFQEKLYPYEKLIELQQMYETQKSYETLFNIFFNKEIFILNKFLKYNELFKIDIKKLTNGTAYKQVKEFKELVVLLGSDLNLFFKFGILPVRFCIVIIRLYNFNINISTKKIGGTLEKLFNKENYSHRIKLKNEIKNTDLDNRSFRGFKFSFNNNIKDIQNDPIYQFQLEVYNKLKFYGIRDHILKDIFSNVFLAINK